ncbi:MAG TPA: ATP-binding protein [Cyclobacteriaceae bacterium]|jgi:type II secretory pathway predicted ATPase ExeA|nr:ATP-binding protein [Cyclobacteriaceae bacterium]
MKTIKGSSPFIFNKPVKGKQFLNYKSELEEVYSKLQDPALVFVMGYSGMGKTSFVRELVSLINKRDKSRVVVFVSLKKCKSEFEVILKYVIAVANAFDHKIKLKTLNSKLLIHWMALVSFPDKLAEKKKKKVTLILDDFDVISGMPSQRTLEGILRFPWDDQEWISTCVCIKQTHDMINFYGARKRPFYDTGTIITLKGVQPGNFYGYILACFKNNNQSIRKDAIMYLMSKMNGIPKYIQNLAHHIYLTAVAEITIDVIDSVIEDIVRSYSPSYRKKFNTLTILQKRVLAGYANDKPVDVASRYLLKTYTAVESIVTIWTDRPYFLDPYFGYYLKKKTEV